MNYKDFPREVRVSHREWLSGGAWAPDTTVPAPGTQIIPERIRRISLATTSVERALDDLCLLFDVARLEGMGYKDMIVDAVDSFEVVPYYGNSVLNLSLFPGAKLEAVLERLKELKKNQEGEREYITWA